MLCERLPARLVLIQLMPFVGNIGEHLCWKGQIDSRGFATNCISVILLTAAIFYGVGPKPFVCKDLGWVGGPRRNPLWGQHLRHIPRFP